MIKIKQFKTINCIPLKENYMKYWNVIHKNGIQQCMQKQLKVYMCARFQFIASCKIWSIECNQKIELNRAIKKQLKVYIKT